VRSKTGSDRPTLIAERLTDSRPGAPNRPLPAGQNDVEVREQYAQIEMGCRFLQRNNQPFGMRSRIEPAVSLVFGFASKVKLSHETIVPPLNRKVNVRRPYVSFDRRVAARFDGAKAVAAKCICRKSCKAFEVGIEWRRVEITWMTIFPGSVGLPDIDARMRHGLTQTGEHASPDMDQLALRVSGATAWTRKVRCKIGAF
jgi:hypothetical protein